MEVGVKVETENVLTGERRHTSTAYLLYVAVDPDTKQPVRVPRLVCETAEERRRQRQAKARRKARTARREAALAARAGADEAARKVCVYIVDTGVGIPPKDLPFVFDKFYRCDANNRMAKGTGLGLSLVRHIVEAVHEGRVFVESEVGKGSSFGFELDLVA